MSLEPIHKALQAKYGNCEIQVQMKYIMYYIIENILSHIDPCFYKGQKNPDKS